VGGPRHAAELVAAVEGRAGVPVLGWLPQDPALTVPERYLGLVPVTEGTTASRYFEAAEAAIARGVDLDRLLTLARATGTPSSRTGEETPGLFPTTPVRPRAAIAVAQDRAFSFYYQDSLNLLAAWGAELVPFSPLEDASLPRGVSGVYLGGGFPELFAAELSANAPMFAALREAHARNLPIYAECGGLMVLGRSLVDANGRRHPMVGIVPLDSSLAQQRLTIAYREARAARVGEERAPAYFLARELATAFDRVRDERLLGPALGIEAPLRALLTTLEAPELEAAAGVWGLRVTPGVLAREVLTDEILARVEQGALDVGLVVEVVEREPRGREAR
jgi:cobyrinic acid a,c-diamide synthase